jgi:hypothetical protein
MARKDSKSGGGKAMEDAANSACTKAHIVVLRLLLEAVLCISARRSDSVTKT